MSRTAALAGGTVLGGDLGNSMVSRVPATLVMCPCHSPETPSGPCFPLSVPVQALLHGKVGSMPTSLLGQKTSTGLPQGPRDPRIPLVISTLPPTPTPVPGAFSGSPPPRGPAGASCFSSFP